MKIHSILRRERIRHRQAGRQTANREQAGARDIDTGTDRQAGKGTGKRDAQSDRQTSRQTVSWEKEERETDRQSREGRQREREWFIEKGHGPMSIVVINTSNFRSS